MQDDVLRLDGTMPRDPAIDAWLQAHTGPLGEIAKQWFAAMRGCGDEVREVLHDGCPVACLGDAPFAYVNVFTAHVNVGFYRGAFLPDKEKLLQGTGKRMRHVKLKPDEAQPEEALLRLITLAYAEMKARVEHGCEAWDLRGCNPCAWKK